MKFYRTISLSTIHIFSFVISLDHLCRFDQCEWPHNSPPDTFTGFPRVDRFIHLYLHVNDDLKFNTHLTKHKLSQYNPIFTLLSQESSQSIWTEKRGHFIQTRQKNFKVPARAFRYCCTKSVCMNVLTCFNFSTVRLSLICQYNWKLFFDSWLSNRIWILN